MNTSFSEQAMALACRFTLIEASLKTADKPHTFFQLLKNFFETIRSQDPNKFHYEIARSALHDIKKEVLNNEAAIDMLARELVRACHAFDEQLKVPTSFAKLIRYDQRQPDDPYLIIVELPKMLVALEEQFFTSESFSIWDTQYLKLLESIGVAGKKQSVEISKKLLSDTMKWSARFWFKEHAAEEGVYFFHTPAFLVLAAVLWEDIVKKRIVDAP